MIRNTKKSLLSFVVFVLLPTFSHGVSQKVVVPIAVQGILEKYCTDCHGAKKKKGDVRLHDIAALGAGFQSSLLYSPECQDTHL